MLRKSLSMALIATAAAGAQAATVSTFESGVEGWTFVTVDSLTAGMPVTGGGVPSPSAQGNPGSAIELADPDSWDFYFAAPAAFLGNRSAALGGTLSYQIWTNLPQTWNGPAVILKGASKTLVYQLSSNYAVQGQWVDMSIVLAPSDQWDVGIGGGAAATAADFQEVLADLKGLWITGETFSGVAETSRLDNVSFPGGGTLPEPGSLLLVASAVAALTARRRSR